jgi:NAD(P)-dependent dehydrogenase (short-subunit alcohol dehydrogenase family)
VSASGARREDARSPDLGPAPALDTLVDEIRALGADADGDMATAHAPARVVGEAVSRFSGLDALVSNAGVNMPGALLNYAVEDWDRMVRTGMTARVYADARIAAERDALVPIGRVATPEDIADAIAFLLGPDARDVNGHDLVVEGGVSGNLLGRLPGLQQITRS